MGCEESGRQQYGEVADSKHGEGNPAWSDHVYNQATFIGASLLLYKATGEKTYLDMQFWELTIQ